MQDRHSNDTGYMVIIKFSISWLGSKPKIPSGFLVSGEGLPGPCKCWLFTCVLRHGGLISVPLFLKDNVSKLQHCRDHFQHAWQGRDHILSIPRGGNKVMAQMDCDRRKAGRITLLCPWHIWKYCSTHRQSPHGRSS